MVRQAAFKGLRADKPADEVEAETGPTETPSQSWLSPKPVKAERAAAAVVMGVPISHPDKALWPDAGDGSR